MVYLRCAAAAYMVLGVFATVAMVGKERKPITGGQAAFVVIGGAAIIVALVVR